MSFQPGFKARILLGDFSLSAKLTTASLPVAVDMLDVTVFADDGVKRFIPGLDTSTASMAGFLDAAAAADAAAWTTAQPLTYAPFGLSLGSQVQLVDTLRSNYETGSEVAGVVSFDLAAQTDGFTDFGVSLHDLAAVSVDENGASVDNGAATTNGGVAHLHVTEFSGLSGAVVTVEDSADNSVWATIASQGVAGPDGQRLPIAGTIRRFTRYVIDVVGTGSVTFVLALARR